MLFVSQDAVLDMIADSDPDSSCREICRLYSDVLDMSAVEVVRCKNCDNFQTDWETAFANGRHYCAVMDSIMPPDGFCSYGERKTNDS